jgi:hypothetical protein
MDTNELRDYMWFAFKGGFYALGRHSDLTEEGLRKLFLQWLHDEKDE